MNKKAIFMLGLLVLFLGFFMMHRMDAVMAHSENCPLMHEMKICTKTAIEHVKWFTGNLPDMTKIFSAALFILFFGTVLFDDPRKRKNRHIVFHPAFAFLTKIYPRLYA